MKVDKGLKEDVFENWSEIVANYLLGRKRTIFFLFPYLISIKLYTNIYEESQSHLPEVILL